MPNTARVIARGYGQLPTDDGEQGLKGGMMIESTMLDSDRGVMALSVKEAQLTQCANILCWATFVAFAFFTAAVIGLYFQGDSPKYCENTFFIVGIAAVAYFFKSLHMGDITIGGASIPVVRYTDWILTTPIMLYEICELGGAPRNVTNTVILADILMLVAGILSICGDQSRKFTSNWLFFSACCFFVAMVFILQVYVEEGAGTQTPEVTTLLFQLKWLTIITWAAYPVVCALGRAHLHLISPAVEDILLSVMDVLSKLGMEALIISSCSDPAAGCHGSGEMAKQDL